MKPKIITTNKYLNDLMLIELTYSKDGLILHFEANSEFSTKYSMPILSSLKYDVCFHEIIVTFGLKLYGNDNIFGIKLLHDFENNTIEIQ